MRRRQLLLAFAALSLAPAASRAEEGGAGGQNYVDVQAAALPIVAEGRLRNYVFVGVRLWVRAGSDTTALRAREPYFRDALVRAAGRQSFAVADDWTRIDESLLSRVMMGEAGRIAGAGVVQRVQVMSQTPQRRTGINPPRR